MMIVITQSQSHDNCCICLDNLDNICLDNICLDNICLDNICLDNNKNKYIKFKCCKGRIHRSCLVILFANNIKTCPLCRSDLKILSYFYTLKQVISNYNNNTYDYHNEDNAISNYNNNIHVLNNRYYNEIFDIVKYFIYCILLFILCIICLVTVLYMKNDSNNKMNNLQNPLIDYY
jgi:hypothetical protein